MLLHSTSRTVVFDFSPWYLAYLVSGSWSPKLCQRWVPSLSAGLNSILKVAAITLMPPLHPRAYIPTPVTILVYKVHKWIKLLTISPDPQTTHHLWCYESYTKGICSLKFVAFQQSGLTIELLWAMMSGGNNLYCFGCFWGFSGFQGSMACGSATLISASVPCCPLRLRVCCVTALESMFLGDFKV